MSDKTIDVGCLPTEPRRASRELWERSALWHGMPKIGKSEMAAQFPNVIFADFEGGLGELSVHTIALKDETKRTQVGKSAFREEFVGRSAWAQFKVMLHDLHHRQHSFQTLVVDTVDRAYLACVKYHTILHGVVHENEGNLGYGKGLDIIARDFLDTLTWAKNLPMGLIVISHSEEKKFTLADGKTERVRIVCTLPKRAMQAVNGMVDMIFYFTFEAGGRVIKTRAGPNYDAGSRIKGLPETLPMSYDALVQAYTSATGGSSRDVNAELIQRITSGERLLSEGKIDGFEVEVRRDNARAKHAGQKNLKQCDLKQLNGYLQYLQTKYRKGQDNGNGAENESE